MSLLLEVGVVTYEMTGIDRFMLGCDTPDRIARTCQIEAADASRGG